MDANHTSELFPNVLGLLRELSRRQEPEIQREAELARQMIFGKRPGIEAKYKALLLKLDRSLHQLEDRKTKWERVAESTPLFHLRKSSESKARAYAMVIGDIKWMKARNADIMKMLQKGGE